MLRTTISHFVFPASFESIYQVAEISLVKLYIRRNIYQPVEKVFIMQQSRGLMALFIEANNIQTKQYLGSIPTFEGTSGLKTYYLSIA